MSILKEADSVINGDRQDSYGSPEDSFNIIADLWNVYNSHREEGPLIPLDVAHMMTLLKMARMLGQKPHRDNYVDAAGYLAIAADRLINDEDLKGGK